MLTPPIAGPDVAPGARPRPSAQRWRHAAAFVALVAAAAAVVLVPDHGEDAAAIPGPIDVHLSVPDIPGESTARGHAGEIVVQDFSFGGTNPVDLSRPGSGAGKVALAPLTLTKRVDLSSTGLLTRMAQGATLGTVTVTVDRASADARQPVARYTLGGAQVTGLQQSYSGPAGAVESVTIDYRSIRVEYRQQLADGAFGPWTSMCWDRVANSANCPA